MTWKLSKSRSMFFAQSGQSPISSFWNQVSIPPQTQVGPAMRKLLDWNPSTPGARSNCPELHETVAELSSLVDPRWKARADNIFAGRTNSSDDLAYSSHGPAGGIVAVSSQFTLSLIAYTNLWSRFLELFDLSTELSQSDWESIETGMLGDFNTLMEAYKTDGLAALLGQWPMVFKSEDHQRAAAEMFQSAERWVVAHELAHHILRHGTSRPDISTQRHIRETLHQSFAGVDLHECSAAQLEEIEADVLAFELIAGEYARDTNAATVIQALQGGVLALIAVGHLREEWLASPDDTHPGALRRLVVLTKWVLSMYSELVDAILTEMQGDLRLRRLCAALVAYALWASGENPKTVAIKNRHDYPAASRLLPIDNYVHLSIIFSALEEYAAEALLSRY